jgi:hypothetical protein
MLRPRLFESGEVGKIRITRGVGDYAYRATINFIMYRTDVLEAGRQLELRGWFIDDMFKLPSSGPTSLPSLNNFQPKGSKLKVYAYTWPRYGNWWIDVQREQQNEGLLQNVADELIAANELLGTWPEDLNLSFETPAAGPQQAPSQEEKPRGLVDRFLDFLDDF